MKIFTQIFLVWGLLLSSFVKADYIIASRDMLLKDGPDRNATTIANIKKSSKLMIVGDSRQNGYYSVELSDGATGYVYRTVGRLIIEENHTQGIADLNSSLSNQSEITSCGRHLLFGIPDKSDQVLCREGYALGYSYDYKIPLWVSYSVTAESAAMKIGDREAAGGFTEDENIPAEFRSKNSDYKSTGYDKGHMAPNAVMDFNLKSQKESFLLSNMAPQLPGFNRNMFEYHGVWGYVEDLERMWIKRRGELIVIAGTYVATDAEYIGDEVAVPSNFYRILFDPVKLESLAFWFPHDVNTADNIASYLTSIDDIESKTGIDFFNFINSDIQATLESKLPQSIWN